MAIYLSHPLATVTFAFQCDFQFRQLAVRSLFSNAATSFLEYAPQSIIRFLHNRKIFVLRKLLRVIKEEKDISRPHALPNLIPGM